MSDQTRPVDTKTTAMLMGLRVLVVDDDADNGEILSILFTQYGSEVTRCASAKEAIQLLRQWKPDAIISDICLPSKDGYEMMKEIRALKPEQGGAIPAIALTGYASPEDESRALAAGYQVHLSKPVDFDHLVAMVAGLIVDKQETNTVKRKSLRVGKVFRRRAAS